MKLTKKSDYSVRILMFIARSKQVPVPIREIASGLSISEDYTRKIVQELIKYNFLISTRGATGGIKLACPPNEMSIEQLLLVTEDVSFDCQNLADCSTCIYKGNCQFDQLLLKAQREFYKSFRNTSLQDLI